MSVIRLKLAIGLVKHDSVGALRVILHTSYYTARFVQSLVVDSQVVLEIADLHYICIIIIIFDA